MAEAAAVAKAAALRRLSSRAATLPSSPAAPSFSHQDGLLTFSEEATAILDRLKNAGVDVLPGLSDAEFARIEAECKFNFPPDLRALLSLGLPAGLGFPDWRRLRRPNDLPIAALSIQIARDIFWPRSLGPRPAQPAAALRRARPAILRAPPLVPLFRRCYLPSSPCLAGNPVFSIHETKVSCCAGNLSEFFLFPRGAPAPPPRRIELWSEAAERRRMWLSCEEFVEIRPARLPDWAWRFLEGISAALREGGWGAAEVEEMVHSPGATRGEEGTCLAEIALEGLLLKADRCSDSLRRGGWSDEEVADAINLDFSCLKGRSAFEKEIEIEIRG
ncbi:uncharacterized protein LOC144714032 [Wolffia australiana]